MPEVERLDEMCVLITGQANACFANLTDISQRITVIQMTIQAEQNDALWHVGRWFEKSRLYEGPGYGR